MDNQGKILVIDDSLNNLILIENDLSSNGYKVFTASNGELGLIVAKEKIPDLIILDILMPGLNGFEVLSKLKQNSDTSRIPVILLTAIDDIEMRVKGLELGAVDYITKPFQEYDLLARVKLNIELVTNRKKIFTDEQFYTQLFELHTDSILLIEHKTGKLLMANNQASLLYGYTIEELMQLKNTDLSAEPDETRRITETAPAILNNIVNVPLRWHKKKDGTVFPVEITGRFFEWNNKKVHISAIRDISTRIALEKQKNIQIKILEQLNFDTNDYTFINNNLKIIKDQMLVDAIALKYIDKDNNISTFEHIGFDTNYEFDKIAITNTDDSCAVSHICICGFIINQMKSSLLTEFGSFFTNNLYNFASSKAIENEKIVFNNTCLKAGFKSLALIPIYDNKNQKVGLLQLNHRTENFFNSEIITLLENVSQSISLSMLKKSYIDKIKISEQKFKNLVNNISEIIVTINSEKKISFISNSISKQFGYQYKELLNKSILNIIYDEDKTAFENYLNSIENNSLNPISIRVKNKAKNPLWCRFSGIINKDDLQEQIISGVISIIEESKQNEIKINNLKKELEQIIYVTSHDLRSPLVNIHGFTNEIKKQLTKHQELINTESNIDVIKSEFNKRLATITQFFNFIFPSITKINNLIDALLSLSRIGRIETKFEQIDMNLIIKNILAVLEFRIKQNNITVNLANLANCFGDEKLVNQLFSNLIDNAIKYKSPNRNSFIKIYSEELTESVAYFIEDNGIGINEPDIEKIFTLYYRAVNNLAGDGLGLTIVKKIIDKLDAKIEVDSELDKGSCFKITFKKVICCELDN